MWHISAWWLVWPSDWFSQPPVGKNVIGIPQFIAAALCSENACTCIRQLSAYMGLYFVADLHLNRATILSLNGGGTKDT